MLQSYDLLDLTITLTPPQENAPVDALASMTVRCDALGLNHAAGLLTDPLTPQERADLRWYLEEYSQWPYAEFAVRGKRIEAQLSEIGKRLYQTVFGSVMGQVQPWRLLPTKQRQISIVSTVPAALSLPWELLHDEQGFLVLRTRQPVALLRRLEQHELSELPIAFKPPLRVLVVTARPSGTGFLDPRSLPRELLDAVQPQIDAGAVEVEFLRPPTRAALRQRLAQTKYPVHLLHFDGHGVFAGQIDPHDTQHKQGGGQGMLAFEDAEGKLDLVPAEDLAQLLQDSGVNLAVLDACQSAMSAADDAFSSVAARLIQGGVGAAIAMSASVLVVTSTRFFARFYRELAAGTPAPIALERARQDLYDDPRRHLFRRTDEEGQPVELRDWWLPHFYQQRPLTLRATRVPRKSKKQPMMATRFNDEMPKQTHYRFSGRARELLQIERHLLRKQVVILSGFGGVGKTSLAREAADWLTRTGMYVSACFISFEHGGDTALLLSRLGRFLGIYDGHYNPNDPNVALTRLQPALAARPTLVIADNLESLLPNGEATLEREARTQLWQVLRELATLSAGVLLTSRDPLAGEDQLAPGAHIAALSLHGLTSYDAYILATQLLEDLAIPRARAPYAELRDLLLSLDHHPLAIQLVLPTLRERTLTTIRTDFAALLPSFTDDHTEGRNRSLLASLDYSLRRLTEPQRALLPRLALFEGGASEDDLLAITEIPETVWATLRAALEQTALLIPELVPGFEAPFLRFHPVLTPFLRHQAVAALEDKTLYQRYVRRYAALAGYLNEQDYQHPEPVRMLLQRELPNLRHALVLLLHLGELETALHMSVSLIKFLGLLGLLRERDQLRQRIEQIADAVQSSTEEEVTRAEYLLELSRAEGERQQGALHAALNRLNRLLARIQGQPIGSDHGPGSFAHCYTLTELGRYLHAAKELRAAESRLHEALSLLTALLQQDSDKETARVRANALSDLGQVLSEQGRYPEAQEMFEQALKEHAANEDTRNVASTSANLGVLTLLQGNYDQARTHLLQALRQFRGLEEPPEQAAIWHNLGIVAERQKRWAEAERCYRQSLSLSEQLGNMARAAHVCNALAIVAKRAGKPTEAEGWYLAALERIERVEPDGHAHANYLNNLASLLVDEVRAEHVDRTRLNVAARCAEQARRIREQPGQSSEIWKTFAVLAEIAELEGQVEVARDFHRRERESFAAFAGNRYHIDQECGEIITGIAAAATGDKQIQAAVMAQLPRIEARGRLHIAAATRRIWAGERDWHTLAEELDRVSALIILRVLETIAAQGGATPVLPAHEPILASLPKSVHDALQEGDQDAFDQALAALSPAEQQRVLEALQALQDLTKEGESK